MKELSKTIVKRIEKTVRTKRIEENFNDDNRVFIQEDWSNKARDQVIQIRIPSLRYSRRGTHAGRIRTVKALELPIDTPLSEIGDAAWAVGKVLAEAMYRDEYRIVNDRTMSDKYKEITHNILDNGIVSVKEYDL
jgi:hypothetical protein